MKAGDPVWQTALESCPAFHTPIGVGFLTTQLFLTPWLASSLMACLACYLTFAGLHGYPA